MCVGDPFFDIQFYPSFQISTATTTTRTRTGPATSRSRSRRGAGVGAAVVAVRTLPTPPRPAAAAGPVTTRERKSPTPSRRSPAGRGPPSPTSSWCRWRTSSRRPGTSPSAKGSTSHYRSTSQKHRLACKSYVPSLRSKYFAMDPETFPDVVCRDQETKR